jgi:hypothetical protein
LSISSELYIGNTHRYCVHLKAIFNLDAYFDILLIELIEKIDLQENIKEALTKRTGGTGFYVYNCH